MASGSGWNLWVWLLGVVVRRYIDFLILLIPTPLVSVLLRKLQVKNYVECQPPIPMPLKYLKMIMYLHKSCHNHHLLIVKKVSMLVHI